MTTARRTRLGVLLLVLGVAAASSVWQSARQATLGARVAALAGPGDLRMISSDHCGICVQARQWFERHGVAFSECSIERDAACAATFEALRAPGTPVILVRGQPVLGFDPQRLHRQLEGG